MPILSDCTYGYFLARSEEETARFTRSMRRRAKEILRVARAVESPKGGEAFAKGK